MNDWKWAGKCVNEVLYELEFRNGTKDADVAVKNDSSSTIKYEDTECGHSKKC